jgi:hypothetical protein
MGNKEKIIKRFFLLLLGIILFSAVCFGQNIAEIGFSLIRNPVLFPDNAVIPGINAAFFPRITDFFGIGIHINFGQKGKSGHLDLLVGPYFAYHFNEKFTVLGSAGFYTGIIFFGFGGQLSAQYAVHKNIALFARMQGNFAYFMAPGIDSFKSYTITPSIGVGFRF